MKRVVKEELTTERGTKFYVYERVSFVSNANQNALDSQLLPSDLSERSEAVGSKFERLVSEVADLNSVTAAADIMGFDELMANTRGDFLETVGQASYLRNAALSRDLIASAKSQ